MPCNNNILAILANKAFEQFLVICCMWFSLGLRCLGMREHITPKKNWKVWKWSQFAHSGSRGIYFTRRTVCGRETEKSRTFVFCVQRKLVHIWKSMSSSPLFIGGLGSMWFCEMKSLLLFILLALGMLLHFVEAVLIVTGKDARLPGWSCQWYMLVSRTKPCKCKYK